MTGYCHYKKTDNTDFYLATAISMNGGEQGHYSELDIYGKGLMRS